MFQLDFRSGVSICDQIVNGIIRLKSIGVMKSGEQLPAVRLLATKLNVNPNTVQKAYSILENDGIIYSVRGKGSFISEEDSFKSAIKQNAQKEFLVSAKNAIGLGLSVDELKKLLDTIKEEDI